MPRTWNDLQLFWREFRENFHTTGAVLPSGRLLARKLAYYVRHGEPQGQPRRILEAGPGTGAVTHAIVDWLRPTDRLDLVEINPAFAERLRQRLSHDPHFARVAERTRVLTCGVETLAEEGPYDLVVSGLPLNNFAVADVRRLLEAFRELLRPGGVLSFFEYIAVRRVKSLLAGGDERRRLSEIGSLLASQCAAHEVRREWVLNNVPPAWVHHLTWPAATAQPQARSTVAAR